MDIEFEYSLTEPQIYNLLELFQEEIWSKNRTLDDVKKMLKSNWVIAIIDPENDKIVAFARVLTDYIYRAFIHDVIVAKEYRALGYGKLIVNSILTHEDIKNVERIELCCVDKNIPFYQKLGFGKIPEGTNMMRYYR